MPFKHTVVITKQDAATPWYWETVAHLVEPVESRPGFIESNSLIEDDGKKITNYDIWASEQDFVNTVTLNFDREDECQAYHTANNITVTETTEQI